MFVPKNAYKGPPGPVTHAYGESPISSKGNLYYSQDEVDLTLSKGEIEGAKSKSKTKYPEKDMQGHDDEHIFSDLPLYFLVRRKDPFYDTTTARVIYLNMAERAKYEVNLKDGKLTIGGKSLDTTGAEFLYARVDEDWVREKSKDKDEPDGDQNRYSDDPKNKKEQVVARNLLAIIDPKREKLKRIEVEPVITDTWIFAMDPNGSIYATDWVKEYKNGGFYDALRFFGPAPKEIVGFNHSSFVAGEPVAAAGEFKVKNGKLLEISNKSGHYVPKPVHIYNFMCELRERDPKFSFKDAKLELMTSANRFAPGVFFSAEEFFNAGGDLSKCKLLDKDKAKEEEVEEEPDITRVACLTQDSNTCGQRAAFNALKLKAHPDDPNAAGQAMDDDAGLRAIGPMNTDVYDDYVRQRLDGNNGGDISLISSLQRVRDFVNKPGEYPYTPGEQDLDDWAHGRRLDVVTLVINTRAVGAEADPSSAKAKYGHYIAIQLVRKNKGAPNEKVIAYYADSLAAGQDRSDLVKELIKALTPQ